MGLPGFQPGSTICPTSLLMDDSQGGVDDTNMNASPTVDVNVQDPKNVYAATLFHVHSEANVLVEGQTSSPKQRSSTQVPRTQRAADAGTA